MTSSSSETKKMIVLRSSDQHIFEIEEDVAANSQTLKNMIEDNCADNVIPLPNVTAPVLVKVIEYCKKHTAAAAKPEDAAAQKLLNEFEDAFVKDLTDDHPMLFDILLAANYLNIKSLVDLTCETTAGLMKGKGPQEIRDLFNIQNDFTPEEEERIRNENNWAVEDDKQ